MTSRGDAGAKLVIHLGRDESQEWLTDEHFRDALKCDLSRRTIARGRRFFQVMSATGAELAMVEV